MTLLRWSLSALAALSACDSDDGSNGGDDVAGNADGGDTDASAGDIRADAASDSAADASGTKLCMNETDRPLVASDAVFMPVYQACVRECSASGEPEAVCVSNCLGKELGISAGCAGCWGDYVHCAVVACPACADPEAATCYQCLDGSEDARACFHVMSECTGFTF